MANPTLLIAGAGGIGQAVALILREIGSLNPNLILGDIRLDKAEAAILWLREGSAKMGAIEALEMPATGENDALIDALQRSQVLLDCLPGSQAPRMAALAKRFGLHYANLTEYVAETDQILQLAEGASTGFVLQTGLAPGFVDVLAHQLFQDFCADFGVEKAESVCMRVGALTRNAAAPHFYGFTWSPVGVATEYVKPAIVVRDFVKTELPSLSERALRVVNGLLLEEDLTSGGAADLPDALAGKVRNLDYKTFRYPGHYAWVDGLLADIGAVAQPAAELEKRMLAQIPLVEEDVVVIFASVTGHDREGWLHTREKEYFLRPITLAGKQLRAIQSTTAAPLAQCVPMLLSGKYSGAVLQSQIVPEDFMQGEYVKAVYFNG